MSRPLEVDVLARGLFDRAAMAWGMRDAEVALEVCRDLAKIEPEYELRLKVLGAKHDGATVDRLKRQVQQKQGEPAAFVGRPITSRFSGRCAVCKGPYTAGADVFWRKGAGAAHVTCGEPEGLA